MNSQKDFERSAMINRAYSVEQSRRVSPSSLTDDASSFAPHRYYVTRFVLHGIPRPLNPLFPHPIKSIVLTSKAAGVAEAITMKNSPRCAHDRCVGESIDKTLCIYGYGESEGTMRHLFTAVYVRMSRALSRNDH